MRLVRVARGIRVIIVPAIVAALVAFPLGVLASHSFSDVPNSHPFHADIAALKDSGVSPGGCGGGKYCPEDFVTRGQMAAFLNRVGALGPGKVPVANASKVDGLDANQLARGTSTTSVTVNDDFDTCGMTTLLSTSATAPASGILMVWGSIGAIRDVHGAETATLDARITVDGVAATTVGSVFLEDSGSNEASVSVAGAIAVTAGGRAVELQAQECVNGMAFIVNKSITTLFVPFGNAGTQGVLAQPASDANNE